MSVRMFVDADGERTEVPFHRIDFPGGESQIQIAGNIPSGSERVVADCRFGSATDLILAGMVAEAAHSRGHRFELFMPYLPAARADRNDPMGAAVYAGIINSFDADSVLAVDPHSDVMPTMISKLAVLDHTEFAIRGCEQNGLIPNAIIAPDFGAMQRAEDVAMTLGIDLYVAEKVRDFDTGKITEYCAPDVPKAGQYLVVDDICDGGGTFRWLADELGVARDNLNLWVTHGIFSGNARQLTSQYASVMFTNSHPFPSSDLNWPYEWLVRIDHDLWNY